MAKRDRCPRVLAVHVAGSLAFARDGGNFLVTNHRMAWGDPASCVGVDATVGM